MPADAIPVQNEFAYTELTSMGTHTVKSLPGFLNKVVVNVPGGATIQIYDGTVAEGTAIAGATAFDLPAAGSVLSYQVNFYASLVIVLAGGTGTSITVSFA
jgi:hypothetical protein